MFIVIYYFIFKNHQGGTESFHGTYNGQFDNTHPPTLVIISVLKETQTQTVAIMKSNENNIIKTMDSKDYDRIILIKLKTSIHHEVSKINWK